MTRIFCKAAKGLSLLLILLLVGCSRAPVPDTPETQSAAAQWVRFDIYAINDLHGKLADTAQQPGVDELSAYLKQIPNALLLSTGDMWQGASESNLTDGRIVTDWMNRMGFAAMTLGGHEYDWGEAGIRQNREAAEFPFLGINIYSRETDTRVDYCQSSTLVEIEGVQIGIIGAIGNCYGSISAEHTQNVYFKTGSELTALVQAEAEKLRREGADFILYAIHDGYDQNTGAEAPTVADAELADYYDAALSDGYVDLVFEADTHYSYVLRDSHGVYHLQAGGNNSAISHAGVLLNKTTGEFSVLSAELLPASLYGNGEQDPMVEQLLEEYADQILPATRLLGANSQYRSSYQLCQLVADLYWEKGLEKWGGAYAIILGGGFISCRSPGYLPVGEVRYSQLQSLFPFDNAIVLCSIRGSDLQSRFLETENANYYIRTAATIPDIDPDGIYYVVTDTYTANYTYNRMTILHTYEEGIYARDLVADQIAAGKLDS